MEKNILYVNNQTKVTDTVSNERIAAIDPLHFDQHFRTVPYMNKLQDTIALVLLLVDILPGTEQIGYFDYAQSAAACRDIGILLGSLKRFGIEPVNVIPELEEKMNLLAAKTNLPPRDTLLHYTVWNPDRERMRTYTGTWDEKNLIKSVKIAMPALEKAIYTLINMHATNPQSSRFLDYAEDLESLTNQMVESIVFAKKNVSVKYFSEELRLYYDPIVLNGKSYLGPGAVEMPMFVYDHLLWSADSPDVEYNMFKESLMPYIKPEFRNIYSRFENRMSLLGMLEQWSSSQIPHRDADHIHFKVIFKTLNKLKSFRMPHKKMAEEAYSSSHSEKHREKGSGGYSPDILQKIIGLQNERFSQFEIKMNK